MAKEGSTVSGLMDSLATMTSIALQYGVPLRDLVNKFAHVRFEPSGFTGNQEIPIAKSIVDYIFRWLGSRFMTDDDKATLGLIDRSQAGESIGSPVSGPVGLAAPGGSSSSTPPALAAPASLPDASGGSTSPDADLADASKGDEPKASAAVVEAEAAPLGGVGFEAPRVEKVELGYLATVGTSNGHANGHSNGHANGHTNGSAKPANGGGITLNLGGTKVAFATQADAPSCMDCGSIMVRNGSCYKCLNCGSTSGCS
jgi:ribonucleoside-diphosphate reductase alpha chain